MRTILFLAIALIVVGCGLARISPSSAVEKPPVIEIPQGPVRSIIESAAQQTRTTTAYTQKYFNIAYPNGDVPTETGACTDVVIRSFRAAGVDLQKEVHEDMSANFSIYPQKWGLAKPDTNIDHRRVPNLQNFFERAGAKLPVTSRAEDYSAGDLVTWMLPGNLPHIGIVSDQKVAGGRAKIIHNIGAGPVEDDILFRYTITGHYRFLPEKAERNR